MKVIRISAVWCSSCIIMKSRFNDVIKSKNIDIEDLDYDLDDIEKYKIGDILPVYIKYDGSKEVSRLIGEHTKEEIENFIGE